MKTLSLIFTLLFSLFISACVVEPKSNSEPSVESSDEENKSSNAENKGEGSGSSSSTNNGDGTSNSEDKNQGEQSGSSGQGNNGSSSGEGETGGSPTGRGSTGGTNGEVKPDPISQKVYYQVSGDIRGLELPIQLRYKDSVQSALNQSSYAFSVESGESFSLSVNDEDGKQVCDILKNNFIVDSDVTDAHIECAIKDEHLLSLKANVSGLVSKVAIRIGDKWFEITENGEFDYQVINAIEYEVTLHESSEGQTCTSNMIRFTAAQSSQLQITCQDANTTNP